MSSHPIPTHPEPDPGQQAEDTQFYRQVLHDLINMGTDLARILHTQTVAHAQAALKDCSPPEPLPDHTIPFDRIARAVRRSIALARTLNQPAAPARTPAQDRAAARRRILRQVEDTIHRTPTPDTGTAEALNAELRDRLDAPDLDDDLATRPVADIIKDICRDLGLSSMPGATPWKRRTPADIAQLSARAAAPTTPRHPNPAPQGQEPGPTPHQPDPHPPNPAAALRTGPTPATGGSTLPNDPAEAVALILRHPRHQGQPHPPPKPTTANPGGP